MTFLSQTLPNEGLPLDSDEAPFFFISENPSSETGTADILRNRAAINSWVTKSYWRQSRRDRGGKDTSNQLQFQTLKPAPKNSQGLSPSSRTVADDDGDSCEQQTYSNTGTSRPSMRWREHKEIRAKQRGSACTTSFGDRELNRSKPPSEVIDEADLLPDPNSFLGPGSEDPFGTYPSQLGAAAVARLTHHCKYELL